jgi:hypothetical protein
MTLARRLGAAAVRAWTRLYTWRLPPSIRNARRAEIASDLWEFEHDPERGSEDAAAFHVLARLAIGIPADLSWRAANRRSGSWAARIVALTTAAALVLAGLWVYQLRMPQRLPVPPGPMAFVSAPPPPPAAAAIPPPR